MPARPARVALVVLATFCVAAGGSAPRPEPTGTPRFTAETPDGMVDAARARALATKAPERDVVASIVNLADLADRASYGRATKALDDIARGTDIAEDVRGEAAAVARALSGDEGTAAGTALDKKLGIITELAILGPFRDTGGGLVAKEGPEEKGHSFGDMRARYSWGTIDVPWRTVPANYATARGVPLDLFIHPRKESCTIAATRVSLDGKPIVVRLAATGQVRLMFDGVELGKSEDVHASALLDRLAAKVEAKAGDHLIAAKVCSGALADDGHVRIRITAESGAPIAVTASAELRDPPAPTGGAKVTVQKLTTPLSRTLAAQDGAFARRGQNQAEIDALLDAAIVRTLGGADDLKSPRAAGMLDAISRAPGLDADRLAMVGYIAPSGANRSGWLNRARSQAEASGDVATKAFTDRRLVAEHLNAHMPDWAMATVRGSTVATATDAEAVLLRASTNLGLGTEALRISAMRELATAVDAAPTTVPTRLLEHLAAVAASYDAARTLKTREALTQRGYTDAAAIESAGVRGSKAIVTAAKAAFDGGLEDADEGLAVARVASRAGEHEVAASLLTELVTWSPNEADAWGALADELAATSKKGQDNPGTMAALRRARDLAPGEARFRAELAMRAPREPEISPTTDRTKDQGDEKYLVTSQAILAKRQGAPAVGVVPDVADRELYWLRAVVMHPDKRVSQLIHYAREIVIAPRTQEELLEDIPAEGDLTEILRARVHHKDGGTAFPVEEHNEGSRPRIRWPELSSGDTVEVAIRTWTSAAVGGRGDPPFYFLDYAGSTSTHPLLYNEVVVETSPQHPLYLDVIHGAPDRREERDDNGRHVTRLIWDKPVIIAEEPLAPQLTEVVPVIVGSTFRNWGEFRTWYAEAVRGFTEPDAEVRRLAAELTKGKVTREAKLEALFDFVADDIRYVNYVSGEWWLPNRPQQLLARREGDCDDKAILLITLLRSVGIDAQEVMVQTRETGQPSVLLAKNVAVPMFDHGIAFLPGPNGGKYLDATSPQSRLGPLPSMDARAVALRMDAGPAEVVQMPASSPDDHGSEVSWTITLHADGSGDLVGEEKHTGDGAFWLRSYLTQADARAQYVEDNLVGGWFPTVQVDKKIDFNGNLKNGQAWVKYSAHSDGLARHEQGELVVPLSPSATLAYQLAPLVKRTLPVSLPSHLAPSHQRRTIRVIAPAGYRWGELPPGGDENGGEFGSAHIEIAKDPKDPRAVLIKRTVVFDQSLIPVEKYAAWRGFIQRVDAIMHKSVRLMSANDGVVKRSGK